jgi:hypothetical protein
MVMHGNHFTSSVGRFEWSLLQSSDVVCHRINIGSPIVLSLWWKNGHIELTLLKKQHRKAIKDADRSHYFFVLFPCSSFVSPV